MLKQPWVGSKADIEVERDVYERLGPHPRILKYLGPGPIPTKSKPAQRSLRIRLEYQAKGTLRKLILSGSEVFPIKWAEQIAKGLEYLHQNGIVHCDISANNILITDSSDAVLCDFAGLSIDGMKVNGVSYERRCSRRYDYTNNFSHRDDLFAFGTVVYELSTLKRPYEDKTDEQVRQLYKRSEFRMCLIWRWGILFTNISEIATRIHWMCWQIYVRILEII